MHFRYRPRISTPTGIAQALPLFPPFACTQLGRKSRVFLKSDSRNDEWPERVSELKTAIAESERRLQECVARVQAATEGAMRDAASQSSKAQTDLAMNLSKQVGDSATALLAKLSEHFQV